jgi:flagellar hook-associated protein 3 FlgL
MRVTEKMLYDRAARDTGTVRGELAKAVARATTGARFTHPGEAPAAAGLVTIDRARAERLDAIATTAQRAADELAIADGALGEISNAIARAREVAVQLSSSSYGAAERAGGAKEVRGLMASIHASLDARSGSRFVFGGRMDGASPFDAAGTYVGDAGVREVEIAPGVLQAASVRADVALKGVGGGTDVLATLEALATALEGNDPAGVRASLDGLVAGTGQVAVARAEAGAMMSALDAAVSAGQAGRDAAKASVSRLVDVDPIQAALELSRAQSALEASLTATAKGLQLSLLDVLG